LKTTSSSRLLLLLIGEKPWIVIGRRVDGLTLLGIGPLGKGGLILGELPLILSPEDRSCRQGLEVDLEIPVGEKEVE
jgi:hypothetical protein